RRHIERARVAVGTKESPATLDEDLTAHLAILEVGHRHLKVSFVGEPVGADHPTFGKGEVALVDLHHHPSCAACGHRHAYEHAARNHGELVRGHVQPAELGADVECAA